MRGKWAAGLALIAMLASCGTVAPPTAGPAARPAQTAGPAPAGAPAAQAALTPVAPVGSRPAASALAGQLLSRLVVPAGSQAADPSPVPLPLSVSSGGDVSPYTVELHRFVLVPEPAVAVHSFLLRHVPAGMAWYGDDLVPDPASTVTAVWVAYRPRSVPVGLTGAELDTAALPVAGGTLIRADASVSWFPPRSAAEHLTAASFRSVTVTVREMIPPRAVTRTFTSAAVIERLAALVNSLPATPFSDLAAMKCLAAITVYRLDFTPGVVIEAGECGGTDVITVGGKQQPRLWDSDALTAAARRLLHLPT